MKISLGSTAVVTGGASGLGRALCLELARRGVAVAVADRDAEGAARTVESMEASGGALSHFSIACDIRRTEDLAHLRDQIKKHWRGRLDLLINNAGIASAGGIAEISEADWQRMLDINLMGAIRGCRELVPLLRASNSAHIVNIASFAGLAQAPGMISYNVAKAGVIALSESLRGELWPLGIGVSVACPAFFTTNLLKDFKAPPGVKEKVEKMMQRSDVQAQDVAEDILAAVNKGRFMVITHGHARRAHILKRLFPERFFKMIVKQTSGWNRSNEGNADD